MKFYNDKEPLYLDKDASGVGLGAGLLQAEMVWGSHGMKHLRTLHCTLQHLQARASQSRNKIQQYKKRGIRHTSSLEKLNNHCFTHEVSMKTYHMPLVVIFKRHYNPVTKITADPPVNTPVQDKSPIQARPAVVYCWLVIQAQPY